MKISLIRRLFGVLALGTVLAMAAISEAQPGGKGRLGAGGPGGGGLAGVMMFPGVADEIKLTDDQKAELKTMIEGQREKQKEAFGSMKDLSKEDRMAKFGEMRKTMAEESKKGLVKVLKPEQMKRLNQIYLQQTGVVGYEENEDLRKSIKLDEEQRSKLKEIGSEFRKDLQEIFSAGRGGNNQEGIEKMQALRKETLDKAAKVLTEEQTKQWKSLIGEPFEFEMKPRE